MIKCKGCGAGMRFDIEKQMLVCDYCDSTLPVDRWRHADVKSEEQLLDGVIYTCSQCGAELFTTEETAATFCSYCGSSILLESRLVAVNKPDYIIPFKVTQEEAIKQYKKTLRRAIFAPSSIKKAEIEAIRGIYMPYWEYYMEGNSSYSFTYKTNHKTQGDYSYYDQNKLSFNGIIKCDGLEYDASSALPDDLSEAYAPYYFKESKLFAAGYMSGFYADLGNVPSERYEDDALATATSVIAEEIGKNIDGERYAITDSDIARQIVFGKVTPGLAMYPVWFTCARSKNGKYINYAAINGQSGKVAADLPVDKKKIIIGTLLLAIPIFAILVLIITPTPKITLGIVFLLSLVGMIIAKKEISTILMNSDGGVAKARQKKRENQIGRLKPKKASASVVTRYLLDKDRAQIQRKSKFVTIRTIIALALCAIIYFGSPVYDYYYYVGAIASSILCLFNFWAAFDLYNKSIERTLPQLSKRGGDM